jgi:hypothetical protein
MVYRIKAIIVKNRSKRNHWVWEREEKGVERQKIKNQAPHTKNISTPARVNCTGEGKCIGGRPLITTLSPHT